VGYHRAAWEILERHIIQWNRTEQMDWHYIVEENENMFSNQIHVLVLHIAGHSRHAVMHFL
jgi:hypothetical protein